MRRHAGRLLSSPSADAGRRLPVPHRRVDKVSICQPMPREPRVNGRRSGPRRKKASIPAAAVCRKTARGPSCRRNVRPPRPSGAPLRTVRQHFPQNGQQHVSGTGHADTPQPNRKRGFAAPFPVSSPLFFHAVRSVFRRTAQCVSSPCAETSAAVRTEKARKTGEMSACGSSPVRILTVSGFSASLPRFPSGVFPPFSCLFASVSPHFRSFCQNGKHWRAEGTAPYGQEGHSDCSSGQFTR